MQVSGAVASRWQAMGQAAAVAAGRADGARALQRHRQRMAGSRSPLCGCPPAWTDADRRQAALRSRWANCCASAPRCAPAGSISCPPAMPHAVTGSAGSCCSARRSTTASAASASGRPGMTTGRSARWCSWAPCCTGSAASGTAKIGAELVAARQCGRCRGYWLPPVDPGSIPLTPHDLVFCGWQSGATDIIFGDDACAASASHQGHLHRAKRRNAQAARRHPAVGHRAQHLDRRRLMDIRLVWHHHRQRTRPGHAARPRQPDRARGKINGQAFGLLAESLQRDRSFPTSRIRISGRGIAAALADPTTPSSPAATPPR